MSIFQLLFYFLVIIPSAVVHEVAHGVVAYWLGDDTARRAGRLTLNPIAHIDWFGTLIMPISLLVFTKGSFLFAYAKPVPYNPYNLKSETDELKVALAGPVSNILLAGVFAIFARVAFSIPSMSHISFFFALIVKANISLAIFNLVPIPPLDGSKLLYLFIPKENYQLRAFLNQYGMVILLFFIFFGFEIIIPIVNLIVKLLLGF